MDFLTEDDVRLVATATLHDRRLILAVPDEESVLHIWQLDRQAGRLVAPAGLTEQRMPGEKHSGPHFAWVDLGDGREQLNLFYGSRPPGVITGPFPLTYQALPWTRPARATIHAELLRLRGLMEDAAVGMGTAAAALDKAVPG